MKTKSEERTEKGGGKENVRYSLNSQLRSVFLPLRELVFQSKYSKKKQELLTSIPSSNS